MLLPSCFSLSASSRPVQVLDGLSEEFASGNAQADERLERAKRLAEKGQEAVLKVLDSEAAALAPEVREALAKARIQSAIAKEPRRQAAATRRAAVAVADVCEPRVAGMMREALKTAFNETIHVEVGTGLWMRAGRKVAGSKSGAKVAPAADAALAVSRAINKSVAGLQAQIARDVVPRLSAKAAEVVAKGVTTADDLLSVAGKLDGLLRTVSAMRWPCMRFACDLMHTAL